MAKFSLTQLLLVLVLIFTVVSMVPEIDAATCTEVLNPTDCKLEDCKSQCFQKHNSNGGQCAVNGGTNLNPTYECLCVYDC